MSAPIATRHPACDGAGCAACLWTGSPVDASALLACPTCRREWRACACVCFDEPHDPLDIAAGYAIGGERHIGDLPAWAVSAPFEPGAYATARVNTKRETTR